jgi:hypothetical protein
MFITSILNRAKARKYIARVLAQQDMARRIENAVAGQ